MRRISLMFLFFAGSTLAWGAVKEADMVIYNGKIVTADSPDQNNFSIAQGAAIFNGKFLVVGSNDQVLQHVGPNTQKIDLSGRTVLPGLIETHDHIHNSSAHFFTTDNAIPQITWTTREEGLAQLRTLALAKKPGEWVQASMGRGAAAVAVNEAIHKGEMIRFDLDKAAPNNPIWIGSAFFGSEGDSIVNTKALDLLLARHPNIPGVRRDSKGIPTGHLSGVADQTVPYEFLPLRSPEVLAPFYRQEMEEIAAQGITTVSTRLDPASVAAYGWLNAKKELPIRMAFSLETAARSENPDSIVSRMVGLQGGSGKRFWGVGDEMYWIIGLSPIAIDTVPGNAGSCINKTYPREARNFPLWRYQFFGPHGLCRLEDPNYRDADLLRAAAKYGFRIVGMHTGGDRGIDQLFDLMDEMTAQYPDLPERRWAIDHCRFLTDEHARRAKKFNMIFSCGPKYVYGGERGDIGAYSIIYDKETATDVVVPIRRLLNNGLRTVMEIDQHGFHPFLALQVPVTRRDIEGKVWGPGQRIDRREALYMYTRWSAEYVLREDTLGSIEANKAADFIVLNRDYLTVPEDEIGQIDPVLTVIGGNIVYSEPAFASSLKLPQIGYRGDRSTWWRGTPVDQRLRGN